MPRTDFSHGTGSPQLELWELDDEQWRKVVERLPRMHRRSGTGRADAEQIALPLISLLLLMIQLAADPQWYLIK